jgi:predicted negative regulator of RcsB-dependent stress response
LSQLRPDLPEELVRIVHRLLKKSPEERYGSATEVARELRAFIDTHLAGLGDKMIPFSGLVIERQAVASGASTLELQRWMKGGSQLSPKVSASRRWLMRVAVLATPMLLGMLVAFGILRIDLFANQRTATAGVIRESSIQRQFAKAIVENDLKHWNAVSEYFPPTDAISRTYQLKSELQIARLRLEGEDFASAESALRRVLNSPHADDVLTTIARIELGWLTSKTRRETISNEHYDRAIRDLTLMVPEKQRLIREALPAKVRTEWENVDYLHKEPPTTELDP